LATVETIVVVVVVVELPVFLPSASETQSIERFPEILESISSCLL